MKFPARGHFHKNSVLIPGTHLLGFTATGVLADSGITTKVKSTCEIRSKCTFRGGGRFRDSV